jgi:hypothetical protein
MDLNQKIQDLNNIDWEIEGNEDYCIEGAQILCDVLNSFDDLQVKYKLKAKSFICEDNRIYFGRNFKLQIVITEEKIADVGRNDGTYSYSEFSSHSFKWYNLVSKPEFLKKVILHYINQ